MIKLKRYLGLFVLFSLVLNSCDEKNARLVNRRIATPERIEEVKAEAEALEVQSQAGAKLPLQTSL